MVDGHIDGVPHVSIRFVRPFLREKLSQVPHYLYHHEELSQFPENDRQTNDTKVLLDV